jgi:hypothetical protein
MSAFDEFVALVENTDVMKQMQKSLREGFIHFLGDICREFQGTSQPVPDHHLQSTGYMGETTIEALVSAGLIKRQSGGHISSYSYEPTPEGLAHFEKLKAEGVYNKK